MKIIIIIVSHVFFIPAPCFLMCIMFHVVLIWIHVYVFAIHFMVHCRSAFEPGASGLPYCCTSICVRSCCNWRARCVDSTTTKKTIYIFIHIYRHIYMFICWDYSVMAPYALYTPIKISLGIPAPTGWSRAQVWMSTPCAAIQSD